MFIGSRRRRRSVRGRIEKTRWRRNERERERESDGEKREKGRGMWKKGCHISWVYTEARGAGRASAERAQFNWIGNRSLSPVGRSAVNLWKMYNAMRSQTAIELPPPAHRRWLSAEITGLSVPPSPPPPPPPPPTLWRVTHLRRVHPHGIPELTRLFYGQGLGHGSGLCPFPPPHPRC